MTTATHRSRAIEVFRRAGGILRTSEAIEAGVHPRDLYALRDEGVLERVSRGVYRLSDLPPLSEPDLVTVAARVPKAIFTLISALHFHGLTTEIPHAVSIALPRGTATPRLDWPPLDVYRYSGEMLTYGVETHERDGVTLQIYSPAKTIADCFRFRNRIGTDVGLEALRTAAEERKTTPAEIMRAAEICGVAKIMRPYLEAIR